MSALLEAFRALALFSLVFIVIPVGVFVADLFVKYIKKQGGNNND